MDNQTLITGLSEMAQTSRRGQLFMDCKKANAAILALETELGLPPSEPTLTLSRYTERFFTLCKFAVAAGLDPVKIIGKPLPESMAASLKPKQAASAPSEATPLPAVPVTPPPPPVVIAPLPAKPQLKGLAKMAAATKISYK